MAPKITPAPVPKPSGVSSGSSTSVSTLTWLARTMRTISRTVSATSTSGVPPSPTMLGSAHSAFLAVHGITDTTNRRSGSTPSALA